MNKFQQRLLTPVASLYSGGMHLRNKLYDSGWKKSYQVAVPVISVGNLTVGGTGKTPFVALLLEELIRLGHRPAVISRGYRSKNESGVARVALSLFREPKDFTVSGLPKLLEGLRQSALDFGDEPTMLALRFANVPIYVGRDKVLTARRAIEEANPSVIIADDAFQHRRLQRNLDIVLLDASERPENFEPLPSGRMREPFSALRRAHAVILTKVNLSSPVRVERLRDLARLSVDSIALPSFYEMSYHLRGLASLLEFIKGEWGIDPKTLSDQKIFVFSGVGRPDGVVKLVGEATGANVVGQMDFRDHHLFTSSDVNTVIEAAQRAGAHLVVCTEKDAVKFDFDPQSLPIPVLVARLDNQVNPGLSGLLESLPGTTLNRSVYEKNDLQNT